MPKASCATTEEEMKALVKGLKDKEELSVTRVRELLKVGYTKARRLLDEAMAGEAYVPPVDVPSSTNDADVISYIQKLIEGKREVKPDILRRDLNIGYKRAKRLIDSMGGDRAGVTVVPPIARKRRVGKKKKVPAASTTKTTPRKKRAVADEDDSVSGEAIADGADIIIPEDERATKRRRAEKRIPKHIKQEGEEDVEDVDDAEDADDVDDEDDVEMEEEDSNSDDQTKKEGDLGGEERIVECILDKRRRKHKVEYLLKWVGFPESESSWVPAADAGCDDLLPAYEEKLAQEKEKKHHRRHHRHSSESSQDEHEHHDESHAHIMLMLHQQGNEKHKEHHSHHHGHHHHSSHHDGSEKHKEHHHSHHHSSHHEDGHHSHHHSSHHESGHHEHGHHHHSSHHAGEHGHHHRSHHSHSHGHSHHHSSHHKEGGHHHHHSHSHHHGHGHGHHHSHSHSHSHSHGHGHHHHHSHHEKKTKIADIVNETMPKPEPTHTDSQQCCTSEAEHQASVCVDDSCASAPCNDNNCDMPSQPTNTLSKLGNGAESLPEVEVN